MSRSGYSDDLDQRELAMWRGMVASATRGKRGQALLKELEASLVALPEKRLIASRFAKDGEVCALGSVELRRKVRAGIPTNQAVKQIEKEWPEDMDASGEAAQWFDIAECLAQEIQYINDERFEWNPDGTKITPEKRYEEVLKWVREQIAE